MDMRPLKAWLDGQQRGEYGILPRDCEVLFNLLTGVLSAAQAAEELVRDASAAPIDSDRSWRVWQLLFFAATELPQYHDALVDVLCGIAQTANPDPQGPASNRLMGNIWPDWGDHFERLNTHRHLRQKYDFEPVIRMDGQKKFFNFTTFSAKLINKDGATFVDGIGVFGFFELRDLLEKVPEKDFEGELFDEQVNSVSQACSADLEAVCQWIIVGGRSFRAMENSNMEGFERGYGMPTDFWQGAPGISEERWALWRDRLQELSREDWLSERAREALERASRAIVTCEQE